MKWWALMFVALLVGAAHADPWVGLPGTIETPVGWTALPDAAVGSALDALRARPATRKASSEVYAAPDGSGRLMVMRVTMSFADVSLSRVREVEQGFMTGAVKAGMTSDKPLERVGDTVYLADQELTAKDGVHQHHVRLYSGDKQGVIHVLLGICIGAPDVPSSCEASLVTARLQVDEPVRWGASARKYNAAELLGRVIGFMVLAAASVCVTVLLLRKPRARRSRRTSGD